MVRYSIVFGKKDTADRFLPMGEFYLRGAELERAKEVFKQLPTVSDPGDFIFRVYERYYDKHIEADLHYKNTEYTVECGEKGFDTILNYLMEMPQ